MSDNNDNKNVDNDDTDNPDPTSLVERDKAYVQVYRSTGNHRAAVHAYCAGNKWATENAKASGNW